MMYQSDLHLTFCVVAVLFTKLCTTFLQPHGLLTCQVPLPMGFSRQEHQSGLPFPSPVDLPNPGIEPVSPTLVDGFFTIEPPGSPPAFPKPSKTRNGLSGWLSGSVAGGSPANAEDKSSILGSGRSPGEGNGIPFQYSCLGNPMDREAWWATVKGVTKELDRA